MPAGRIRILLLLSACLISSRAIAQTGQDALRLSDLEPEAATDQAAPATKIVSHSDLVLVPVTLTGKKGMALTGIPKESFHVEEEGKEQTISTFEEVKIDNGAPKPTPETGDQGISNFALDRSHQWRMTIVVLDMLNTPILRQEAAKEALFRYLSMSVTRDEPTALLGLNRSGLHELHPFTTDTAVLIAALKKVNDQYTTEDINNSQAEMTSDLTGVLQSSSDSTASQIVSFLSRSDTEMNAITQRLTTDMTLKAFEQIAEAYMAVPGRKTLIWASTGFPFMIDDPQAFNNMGLDMTDQYVKTWQALMSANLAVYPIDVNGLVNTIFSMDRVWSMSTSSGSSLMEKQITMRSIASATGGRACVDTNDLEKCFSTAVDDSRNYYMLGYYLRADDRKPGWRKLKVKVDVNGAQVRSREGFYVAAPTEDTHAYRQKQITQALQSPVAFTGVRLKVSPVKPSVQVQTASLPGAQKARRPVSFILTVPADNFILNPAGNNALDLEVLALALDAKGKTADHSGHSVTAKLNPAKLADFAKSGLRIRQVLSLAPGVYQVKFAVRDNNTGQIGTVLFPYDLN
jgi:VWFA-related protein